MSRKCQNHKPQPFPNLAKNNVSNEKIILVLDILITEI